MVREQDLLQRPGPRLPRSVVFQPQGLQPSAFSQGVEPEELGLGKWSRVPKSTGRETVRVLSMRARVGYVTMFCSALTLLSLFFVVRSTRTSNTSRPSPSVPEVLAA